MSQCGEMDTCGSLNAERDGMFFPNMVVVLTETNLGNFSPDSLITMGKGPTVNPEM